MEHVIFDIGGVLIDFDFDRLARALSERTGGTPEGLAPLFERAAVEEVETGRIAPETFFRQTMSPLLPGLTYDEWVAAWGENYSVNEPGWALLEEARDDGRTVSVLSNLAPYNQRAIEQKWPHFFRATHHNIYSYDLGLHKPDPEIYRAACRALGAAPAECVFLDDVEGNVEGAREAGLRAFRFTNDRIPEIRRALGLGNGDAGPGA